MVSSHLTNFNNSLDDLIPEINRNLCLIENLDDRVETNLNNLEKVIHNLIQSITNSNISKEVKKNEITKIQTKFKQVNSCADDKVLLATQSIKLIDKYTRQLDQYMKYFVGDIEKYTGKSVHFMTPTGTHRKRKVNCRKYLKKMAETKPKTLKSINVNQKRIVLIKECRRSLRNRQVRTTPTTSLLPIDVIPTNVKLTKKMQNCFVKLIKYM